jgi:hypothetical protein
MRQRVVASICQSKQFDRPDAVGREDARKAAEDLNLASQYSARVRLTGTVSIADENIHPNDGVTVNTLTIRWF